MQALRIAIAAAIATNLETARRTIDNEFGSLRGYLEATGLTDADIERLRTALHG